jgi:hypothetical protein
MLQYAESLFVGGQEQNQDTADGPQLEVLTGKNA